MYRDLYTQASMPTKICAMMRHSKISYGCFAMQQKSQSKIYSIWIVNRSNLCKQSPQKWYSVCTWILMKMILNQRNSSAISIVDSIITSLLGLRAVNKQLSFLSDKRIFDLTIDDIRYQDAQFNSIAIHSSIFDRMFPNWRVPRIDILLETACASVLNFHVQKAKWLLSIRRNSRFVRASTHRPTDNQHIS